MPSNSTAAGFLSPTIPPDPVLEDAALEDFIHDLIAGVTGMDPTLVRPAWQAEPPNEPATGSNWMAFQITRQLPDTYAAVQHNPVEGGGDGQDDLQRHETLDILVSSYGVGAMTNLALLQDGLQIAQNREVLQLNAFGLVDTGEAIRAPLLEKEKYTNRYDMRMTLRREINRSYAVQSLVSAQGTLDAEVVEESIVVSQ